MEKTANLIGRLALGYVFVHLGVTGTFSGGSDHLAWLAFDVLAVAGGVALLLGWHIRQMALGLAVLAVLAAMTHHEELGWVLAGALVLLATRDACSLCLDNRLLHR